MSESRPFVLNVNGDEANRDLVTRTLEKAAYSVVEAADGREALLLARRHPMLIVLDVELPDIGGLDVCRRLKADPDTRTIPVLQTSATFVSTERKVEGLDSGADACLAQPIDPSELVATVRSLLRSRLMVSDITGHGEVGEDHRLRAEQLADLDRRKDEFLGMLAHELRNPLNAIAAANSLMDRVGAQDARNVRLRTTVRRQTRNLARLVDDLLEVSRVTRGKMRLQKGPADLVAILRSAIENTRPLLDGRNQHVEVTLPDSRLCLSADSLRLEQVFVNLLRNASKYSEPGSRVTVECRSEDRDGALRGIVRVKDEGIGIPPVKLQEIFDLFVQVDQSLARSLGGLGLGLTMARSLVQLHGGTIAAFSEGEGRGAEFVVDLPIEEIAVSAETAPTSDVDGREVGGRPLVVLVVEDNRDAREMLRAWLEELGHRVYTAVDGLEGLDLARTLHPDVALVDIGLPGLDGYQVAENLRATPEGRHALLVAITGYGRPEDSARAREAGFDAHLVKPVQPEQLARLIHTPPRPGPNEVSFGTH